MHLNRNWACYTNKCNWPPCKTILESSLTKRQANAEGRVRCHIQLLENGFSSRFGYCHKTTRHPNAPKPHDATDDGLSQAFDRCVRGQCTICVLNIATTQNFGLHYLSPYSQKHPIYLATLHKQLHLSSPQLHSSLYFCEVYKPSRR
jgi:hypothetical protein